MKEEEKKSQSNVQIVYIVERYGQIIGVYYNQTDAVQVQSLSIAKGQLCNLIVKPVIYSQNG